MSSDIVIIDDNMSVTTPFVVRLKIKFPEKNIKVFTKAEEGTDYIISNLEKRIIVFLDCNFTSGIQGGEALLKIRDKTSLVYIVMMSANSANQHPPELISEMINNRGIFYIKNTDTQQAESLVKRIDSIMNSKIDCALEQWIIDNKSLNADDPYLYIGNKKLTLADLLREIRLRTAIGEQLEKEMIDLTIHLLLRNKISFSNDQ